MASNVCSGPANGSRADIAMHGHLGAPWLYDLSYGDSIPVGDRLLRAEDICFTQKEVNDSFSHQQRPIMDLIDALLEGRVHPREVPRIRVAFQDGAFWSADNRRLFAFKHINLDWVPVRVLRWDEQHEFEMKFKNGQGVRAEGGGHLAGMVQRLTDRPLPRSPVMLEAKCKISLFMDDDAQQEHDRQRQRAAERFLKESATRDYLASCIGMEWMFVAEIQDKMMPATLVQATADGTFEACIWNGQNTFLHPCLLPSNIFRNNQARTPKLVSLDDLACTSFVVPNDLQCKLPIPWCAVCAKRMGSSKELRRHERGHQNVFNCLDCSKRCSCSEDLRRHSRKMSHRIPAQFAPRTYYCRESADDDVSEDSAEPGNPCTGTSSAEPLPGTFIVPKDSRSGTARSHGLCMVCHEAHASSKRMREHEKAAHPGQYCCARCQRQFDCAQDLRRHSRATGHEIPLMFKVGDE